jgi:hypothetical protein
VLFAAVNRVDERGWAGPAVCSCARGSLAHAYAVDDGGVAGSSDKPAALGARVQL